MQNELTFEEKFIVALRRITRAADIHSHLLQREFGVTGPQLGTLRVIHRLQPVSAGDLARAAHIGYATLTGILDRLEANGHLTRKRDPADRRTAVLKMTKSGERLLATAPSLLQTRLHEDLQRMPQAERQALLDALLRVGSLMEAEAPGDVSE